MMVDAVEPEDRLVLIPGVQVVQVLKATGVPVPPGLTKVRGHLLSTLVTEQGVVNPLLPAVPPTFPFAGKAPGAATLARLPGVGPPQSSLQGDPTFLNNLEPYSAALVILSLLPSHHLGKEASRSVWYKYRYIKSSFSKPVLLFQFFLLLSEVWLPRFGTVYRSPTLFLSFEHLIISIHT